MRFAYPLKLLLGMVGVLLLLATVNLATLLLARAEARRRETGIRLALGAGRGRILRQYLMESMLLAIGGAAAGAFFARWATGFLAQFVWTGNIDRAHDVSVDGTVFAFTLAIAILSGLLFGAVPAWRALGTDPSVALQHAGRGLTGPVGRAGKLMVVIQVALSLVLVLAAALFTQTLRNLRTLPLGFHAANVLEMPLMNRPGGYTGMDPNSYYPELFQRLSRVPGVAAVSSATLQPVLPALFPDHSVTANDVAAEAQLFLVAPDYFRTLEIPVVAGREFTVHDSPGSPRVAIVSQSLAQRLFPGQQAIGRRVTLPGPAAKELVIAGMVADSYLGSLQKHNSLQVFTSVFQEDAARQPRVLIRAANAPTADLVRRLRQEMEAMGREYPLRIETLDRGIDRALVKERMMASLAAGLGVAALLLAAVGLYGLMSYSVTRRTADIGIRMALGAGRGTILRMVLGESLVLVGAGFALSVPAIYGGSRLAATLLFGVNPVDGWALAMAAGLLTAAALAAVWLPARRAARLDPMESLR